ncbi:MAG: acetyltransferase [Ilumatobacter sp.]|uniref:acetyltransferase n=1 Tax=Ilumatobacter sp. TaxID=1967498 RepID=UPI00391B2684
MAKTSVSNTYGLLGAAGHASDVLGVIEAISLSSEAKHEVVALFVDGDPDLARFEGRRARLSGSIADARHFDKLRFVAAAGYPSARRQIAAAAGLAPSRFVTLIHPTATIGTLVEIAAGSVVLAGATVSPLATLGAHCVVHQVVSIGHDTALGDFVSVMPGATIGGNCSIEDGVLIGSGATVVERIKIGSNAVVGAGAVVVHDVPAGVTVVGAPARPVA